MSDLKWNHSLKFPLELAVSEVGNCTAGLKLVREKSGQYSHPSKNPKIYTLYKRSFKIDMIVEIYGLMCSGSVETAHTFDKY